MHGPWPLLFGGREETGVETGTGPQPVGTAVGMVMGMGPPPTLTHTHPTPQQQTLAGGRGKGPANRLKTPWAEYSDASAEESRRVVAGPRGPAPFAELSASSNSNSASSHKVRLPCHPAYPQHGPHSFGR